MVVRSLILKNKMETEIEIKHPLNIWAIDKQILRQYNPNFNIDWNAQLPTDKEASMILDEKMREWENPKNPFELNTNSLDTMVNNLMQELEDVWEVKFKEKPDVEFALKHNYLFKINMLAGEMNSQSGFGCLLDSPPTMYMSPYHGRIIIPKKFLVRIPKDDKYPDPESSLYSSNFEIEELEWDKPFIESVLTELLSYSIFRQVRGEWKEGYTKTMKAIGPYKRLSIDSMKEVIAQYSREQLTLKNHENWGLYTVADKLHVVWKDRNKQVVYLGILELANKYPLHKIALIDEISLSNGKRARINFFPGTFFT